MKVLKKKKVQMPAKKRDISTTELSPGSSKNRTSALPVEDDPAMGIIGLGSSGKETFPLAATSIS